MHYEGECTCDPHNIAEKGCDIELGRDKGDRAPSSIPSSGLFSRKSDNPIVAAGHLMKHRRLSIGLREGSLVGREIIPPVLASSNLSDKNYACKNSSSKKAG